MLFGVSIVVRSSSKTWLTLTLATKGISFNLNLTFFLRDTHLFLYNSFISTIHHQTPTEAIVAARYYDSLFSAPLREESHVRLDRKD